jgi:hypothetical protein
VIFFLVVFLVWCVLCGALLVFNLFGWSGCVTPVQRGIESSLRENVARRVEATSVDVLAG